MSHVNIHRKDHVKTCKEVTICKPRKEALVGTSPSDNLITDFQPPELQ
jgi:hypothetical protein